MFGAIYGFMGAAFRLLISGAPGGGYSAARIHEIADQPLPVRLGELWIGTAP
jgi:hypothetical protein